MRYLLLSILVNILSLTPAAAASLAEMLTPEQTTACGKCTSEEVCVVTCGSAHCEANGLQNHFQAHGICDGKALFLSGDRTFESNESNRRFSSVLLALRAGAFIA